MSSSQLEPADTEKKPAVCDIRAHCCRSDSSALSRVWVQLQFCTSTSFDPSRKDDLLACRQNATVQRQLCDVLLGTLINVVLDMYLVRDKKAARYGKL